MFDLRGPQPRPGGPLAVVAVDAEAAAFVEATPTLVTGVGKVRAATATTWACLTLRPALVLNLGTAGALRPHVRHDIVHEIGTVIQHDIDGSAIAHLVGTDPAPPLRLSDHPLVLATGDRFVASADHRERLAELADLVDMEGYAVAAAARQLGVPVRLAKVVSDDAGDGASASWSDALARASEMLGEWLVAVR